MGRLFGVPQLALFTLVAVVFVEIGVRWSATGRRFVAVGVSARAARAAGIRVIGYKTATYAAAGFFYALAGVLLAGYLRVPSLLIRQDYLLPTITVVVLGGNSLLGGAGQRGRDSDRRNLPCATATGHNRHGRADVSPIHHSGRHHPARRWRFQVVPWRERCDMFHGRSTGPVTRWNLGLEMRSVAAESISEG